MLPSKRSAQRCRVDFESTREIASVKTWTKADIERRSQKMAELAVKSALNGEIRRPAQWLRRWCPPNRHEKEMTTAVNHQDVGLTGASIPHPRGGKAEPIRAQGFRLSSRTLLSTSASPSGAGLCLSRGWYWRLREEGVCCRDKPTEQAPWVWGGFVLVLSCGARGRTRGSGGGCRRS